MDSFMVPLDVETTGLRPEDGHKLLEIAVGVASPKSPFALTGKPFTAIIKHDRDEVYGLANDYVRHMHEVSGLWDLIESKGEPLEDVDEQLHHYLSSRLEPKQGRAVGNSLRLDMNFIEAYLPQSYEYLHYRFLDVTGLAWWAHENFGVPIYQKESRHEAQADLVDCLEELRFITSTMEDIREV